MNQIEPNRLTQKGTKDEPERTREDRGNLKRTPREPIEPQKRFIEPQNDLKKHQGSSKLHQVLQSCRQIIQDQERDNDIYVTW